MSFLTTSIIFGAIALVFAVMTLCAVVFISESYFKMYLDIMEKQLASSKPTTKERFLPRIDMDPEDMNWWWCAWDTHNDNRALSSTGHYRLFKNEKDCQQWCDTLNRTGFAKKEN